VILIYFQALCNVSRLIFLSVVVLYHATVPSAVNPTVHSSSHPSLTSLFLTVLSVVSLQFFIQYFTDAVSKVLEDLCLFGASQWERIFSQRADCLVNDTNTNYPKFVDAAGEQMRSLCNELLVTKFLKTVQNGSFLFFAKLS